MKAILSAALLLVAVAASPVLAADPAPSEKPVGAGILADQIREGEIPLGDTYTLEVGGRFHRVHTKYMAIKCETCHAGVKFPENIQFLRREEFPLVAYPGAVDRGTCMGCHRGEGALASPFYGVPVK
ncbi:MAG TPA: hypothetical protein VD995_14735 [Azospirillum sp.]|nr:hypothetical protein [Azospirillum sp.]